MSQVVYQWMHGDESGEDCDLDSAIRVLSLQEKLTDAKSFKKGVCERSRSIAVMWGTLWKDDGQPDIKTGKYDQVEEFRS